MLWKLFSLAFTAFILWAWGMAFLSLALGLIQAGWRWLTGA